MQEHLFLLKPRKYFMKRQLNKRVLMHCSDTASGVGVGALKMLHYGIKKNEFKDVREKSCVHYGSLICSA